MAKKRLNKKVAIIGSAVLAFFVLGVIIVVLHFSKNPLKFLDDAHAAIEIRDFKEAESNYRNAVGSADKDDELKIKILFEFADFFLTDSTDVDVEDPSYYEPNWQKRLACWKTILNVDPKNIEANTKLLEFFYDSADSGNINAWATVESSASDILELLEEKELEPDLYVVRAKGRALLSMASLGQTTDREDTLNKAVEELTRLKEMKPDEISTYKYLSQAALLEGELNSNKGVIGARQSSIEKAEEILTECIEVAPDIAQGYINLIELKMSNASLSDSDTMESLESEIQSLTKRFDSDAAVYVTLSKFHSAKLATLDQALVAINKALELEDEKIEYVLVATNLYYRNASINNDPKPIEDAIYLATRALDFPEAKETSGARQFANKRNRLVLYSLLSSWRIELAIGADHDGDESLKEEYIAEAAKTIHEIKQILGTADNINMQKWNGLLELARGNKNAAIGLLYSAYEGFKSAGQPDSLTSYHLSNIFADRPEIGLKKEFLELSITPQNNMVAYKPMILLNYAEVLYDLKSWANGLKIVLYYEDSFGESEQSTLIKVKGYIGAGMLDEAKELLADLDHDELEVLKQTYRLYHALIRNQMAIKNRQSRADVFADERKPVSDEPYNEAKYLDYRAKAMDTLEKLMVMDPGNFNRMSLVISNHLEKKEFKKAKIALDDFLISKPDNLNAKVLRRTLDEPEPTKITKDRLNELSEEVVNDIVDKKDRTLAKALHYEKIGKLDKALDELAKVYKLSPDDNFILSVYFNVALNNDKLSLASDLVEDAKQNNSDQCEGNLYAARLFLVQKLYQDAKGKLDYCIELQPTLESVYLLRSTANNKLGNMAEAIDDIKAARRINPLSKSSAKQYALLMLTRNNSAGQNVTAQQTAEAEKALMRAIILNPKEHDLQTIYATYISDRQPQKALAILGDLQSNFPTTRNVISYAQLANRIASSESDSSRKEALLEIAGTSFKKAYEMEPENKNALNAYSEFLRKTGQQAQATEMLSKDLGSLWRFHLRDSQYKAAEKILLELYAEDSEQPEVIKGLIRVATETRNRDAVEKYSRELLDLDDSNENELFVIKAYLQIGLADEAELKLDSFIERNSESSNAILLKSWIYLSKGQSESALESINHCLELSPEDSDAWRLRGRIHRSMGQYNEALEDLQKSKNIKSSAITRVELAKTYQSSGRVAAAIGELVEALNENQPPKVVRTMLENMYLQSNRKRELKSFYSDVLDKFPDEAYWYFRAGRFYLNEKDYSKAHDLLKKSLELCKTDSSISSALDIYLESLFKAGQYDKSLQVASGYIDGPQAPIAYAQMAQVKYKMGNRATAISYYHKAIEKSQDREFYISGILDNMLKIAGSGEVVKWCNEKLRSDKSSYSANLMMFKLMRSSGQYNKALGHMDSILSKMSSEDPKWINNMIEKANTLIMAYMTTSDDKYLSNGIEVFEDILEEQPDNNSVLNNLAYLLADNDQDLETAAEYSKRAHEASPNDGGYADTYAFVLIKTGEYEKAGELLRTAIQIFERNSQDVSWGVYKNLGMAKEGLGDNGNAAASYQQALEVAGQNISDKDKDWLKKSIERVLQ